MPSRANHLIASLALLLCLGVYVPATEPTRKPLLVSVGKTIRLQMSSKQPIRTAVNDRQDIVRLALMPNDPTTIFVTGLAPGVACVTLTSVDDKTEAFETGKRPAKP